MGLCSSCCRRKRKPRTGEREPLLPSINSSEESLPSPQNGFERVADALAALKAGKLPSQDQLTRLVIFFAESDLLLLKGVKSGHLSPEGKRVLMDVKELLDSFVQWGMEKNYDDLLQEVIFSSLHQPTPPPVQVDVTDVVQGVPPPFEVATDITQFFQSIRTVLFHTFTISAFRLILSDLLFTLREVTIDTASAVEVIARQVEAAAEGIEDAATTAASLDDVKGKAREISEDVAHAGQDGKTVNQIRVDEVSRARAVVVERFQQAMAQAHENPHHRAALLTILSLLQKYASYKPTPSTPRIEISPEFAQYLSKFQLLLERSASGRPLDPLFRVLSATTTDVAQNPSSELHKYLQRLATFVRLALSQPGYVASINFRRDAESMYDSARSLLANEHHSAWARDVRALIAECTAFVESMKADTSTLRMVTAAGSLRDSVDAFISGIGGRKEKWKSDLRRDIMTWVIPRLLRIIKTLPMPRVEILTPKLEGAVDSLYFGLRSGLTPDKMVLRSWNEVVVNFQGDQEAEMSSRVKIHLDGIRLEANHIGYYFKYKNIVGIPGVNYSDEGLISISSGHGLSVDVDVDAGSHNTSPFYTTLGSFSQNGDGTGTVDPLFNVLDVRVSIPGLFIEVNRSKHWLLNKLFVQPTSGPAVRIAAGTIASSRLKTLLERVAQVGGEVVKVAERRRDERLGTTRSGEYPTTSDWWFAMLEKGPQLFTTDKGIEGSDTPQGAPVDNYTTATSKGIIHVSTANPHTEEAEEVVVAVGAGAQLFPDKGGPYDDEHKNDTLLDAARDVEEEVVTGVSTVAEQAKEELRQVAKLRAQVEDAGERADIRESIERRTACRTTWRSSAFNI